MTRVALDLTLQRFGRLIVVGKAPSRRSKGGQLKTRWKCLCDCGKTVTVDTAALSRKTTKSCGCLNAETNPTQTHGMRRTPTYQSWVSMKQRCKNHRRYIEAGIVVCNRWQKFENFLADMGERPPGKTLDRYPDSSGNYEPGNCRWATPKQQARNRKPRSKRG